MKITTSPARPLKSASEYVRPCGSGRQKSGAAVPKGNIVECVATMV
jgi:hypothetical protein